MNRGWYLLRHRMSTGNKRLTGQRIADSRNYVQAMLANGGDVSANGTERVSPGGSTESTGDFLLDFNHANVRVPPGCGEIIIKRDAEVVHKS